MTNRRLAWVLVAVVSTAFGCNDGGQSGTDGSSGFACPSKTSVIDFDTPSPSGQTLEAAVQQLNDELGRAPLVLRWLLPSIPRTETPATVKVTGHDETGMLEVSRCPGYVSSSMSGRVAVRLSTTDGRVDDTVSGTLTAGPEEGRLSFNGVTDAATFPSSTIGRYLGEAVPEEGVEAVGLVLATESSGFIGVLNASTPTEARAIASIAPGDARAPVVRLPYERPASFDQVCSRTELTSFGCTLTTADALRVALTRQWILCSGDSTEVIDFAGLEVTADGRWNHLAEVDGVLTPRFGFGHEGALRIENVAGDGTGCDYVPAFDGAPYSAYEFSEDHSTMAWVDPGGFGSPMFSFTYVAADVPVAPAPSTRGVGERAGAAACGEGEAGVHDHYESRDELLGLLIGSWAFCSGAPEGNDGSGTVLDAAELVFGADGSYQYLGADGRVVGAGTYDFDDAVLQESGAPYLRLTDSAGAARRVPDPQISDAPRKLRIQLGAEGKFSVLSALP